MPRIQFSDVTPPERKSIRDVPIPNGGKRKVPIVIRPITQTQPTEEIEKVVKPVIEQITQPIGPTNFNSKMSEITEKKKEGPYEYYYPKNQTETESFDHPFKKSKKPLIFGTISAIVIFGFVISMMTIFASATINIIPKTEKIEVDTQISALANEIKPDSVRYEVIKLSETKTATVPATNEEMVEIKASGKIIIYNNFSTEPQRLIVRTRFESPEGLIFRIPESVVIPGQITKDGKLTPGSIEVVIFADEAGEKYNIKKSDFTIPGFKNDASRYKNFYARAVTDMTQGFIGKRKVVSSTDKQTAMQNIDAEAELNLQKNIKSKIPSELVLLDNSIIYKSKELSQKDEGSSVVLGKEVTAYALMLNKQDLIKAITTVSLSKKTDWDNIKTTIEDFSLLKVANPPASLETNDVMTLQITGQTKILADIDTNLIKKRVIGIPKKEAEQLINEFTGISNMTTIIRPVWKQSFPKNPSKIYVQTLTKD